MAILLKPENVAQLVFLIRGEKVMLDADLATLYGVSTKALNQAFRRNKNRFPSDFVFQLTKAEYDLMRSQIVTASPPSKRIRSQIVTASRRNISAHAVRFYRARGGDAFQRVTQLAIYRSEHRDHAHICLTSSPDGF